MQTLSKRNVTKISGGLSSGEGITIATGTLIGAVAGESFIHTKLPRDIMISELHARLVLIPIGSVLGAVTAASGLLATQFCLC